MGSPDAHKAVTSCFLDKLSDETGSKSDRVKDLRKPQIAQIFADSGTEAAGRKQEDATRSFVSSSWLLLENLRKSDAHDKSPRIAFRPAFPGRYRGSVRLIQTFVAGVKSAQSAVSLDLVAAEGPL